MDAFDKVVAAEVYEDGQYVLPGTYRINLDRCKFTTTRHGIQQFVIEMTVLESNNDQRKPGDKMSQLIQMNKDAAASNVKQFCAAANEIDPKQVDKAGVQLIFSEANPLAGQKMRLFAYNKPTAAGADFTRLRWIPDGADVAAEVAAEQGGAAPVEAPVAPAPAAPVA